MNICRIYNLKVIENLFDNWQETMIWSCLQGYMGNAWADSEVDPKSAQIVIADFCFLAGEPNKELVKNRPWEDQQDFIIMVPQTMSWGELIESIYQDKARKISRFAIKKEPDVFDLERLKNIINNIKEPFKLEMINEELYNQAMSNSWSRDLCSQFKDYEDYRNRGIGAVVTVHGEIVSGASSYTVYREGIEIEIDTREDYRRKGLALACGARLIVECLERGLYPSWDAHNMGSVALAEKLGYHFDQEYVAYFVNKY